jgi:hypothetical protein
MFAGFRSSPGASLPLHWIVCTCGEGAEQEHIRDAPDQDSTCTAVHAQDLTMPYSDASFQPAVHCKPAAPPQWSSCEHANTSNLSRDRDTPAASKQGMKTVNGRTASQRILWETAWTNFTSTHCRDSSARGARQCVLGVPNTCLPVRKVRRAVLIALLRPQLRHA